MAGGLEFCVSTWFFLKSYISCEHNHGFWQASPMLLAFIFQPVRGGDGVIDEAIVESNNAGRKGSHEKR